LAAAGYVRLPLLRIKCRVLNWTLYFQNKREVAGWDKFLTEIREKHKEGNK
jgi:hypothetical protein